MTTSVSDWRLFGDTTTAWFDAPSLREAAELARRALGISAEALVDLRPMGVRVRVDTDEHAAAVSAAARDLGLVAKAAPLQQLAIVVETGDRTAVRVFWQDVLAYVPDRDGGLVDPLRRDPDMRFRESADHRPFRNRIHLDVVRPGPNVAEVGLGDGSGPYGVCHADPDGNEVDLVPGDPVGDTPATADWQAVFGAMACYRTTSSAQQVDLAVTAASLADDAGFPMLVDLRPGLVVLDSGKDRWDAEAHGLDLDFADLATSIQSAARALGAIADPSLPRFVQLFIDAADVAAVRAFWATTLGYEHDRRDGVTDIVDPFGLNPVLLFQEIDATDTARRHQRNRIHVELAVPPDVAPARVATAIAAGGRLLDEGDGHWHVADPEGNGLVIVAGRSHG